MKMVSSDKIEDPTSVKMVSSDKRTSNKFKKWATEHAAGKMIT